MLAASSLSDLLHYGFETLRAHLKGAETNTDWRECRTCKACPGKGFPCSYNTIGRNPFRAFQLGIGPDCTVEGIPWALARLEKCLSDLYIFRLFILYPKHLLPHRPESTTGKQLGQFTFSPIPTPNGLVIINMRLFQVFAYAALAVSLVFAVPTPDAGLTERNVGVVGRNVAICDAEEKRNVGVAGRNVATSDAEEKRNVGVAGRNGGVAGRNVATSDGEEKRRVCFAD